MYLQCKNRRLEKFSGAGPVVAPGSAAGISLQFLLRAAVHRSESPIKRNSRAAAAAARLHRQQPVSKTLPLPILDAEAGKRDIKPQSGVNITTNLDNQEPRALCSSRSIFGWMEAENGSMFGIVLFNLLRDCRIYLQNRVFIASNNEQPVLP